MPKAIVIGHSHIGALQTASRLLPAGNSVVFDFLLLRDLEMRAPPSPGMSEEAHKAAVTAVGGINQTAVAARIAATAADVGVLYLNGNEHAGLGLFQSPSVDHATREARLEPVIRSRLPDWLDFLLPLLPKRVLLQPPPPPPAATALEGNFPPQRILQFKGLSLEPPEFRLRLWQHQCRILRQICAQRGIAFVDPPADVFDAAGLLAPSFWGSDPMHANKEYGRRILARLTEVITNPASPVLPPPDVMDVTPHRHPYTNLPDSSFWKQSISMVQGTDVDPVSEPPFRIAHTDRVATAGSCFAQHISKRLRTSGFRFFVAEPAPDDAPSGEPRGYYDFSARYGNIYTARQLVQLFDRAFGYFRPTERVWQRNGGGLCDPFRPRIEPAGFPSEADLTQDRRRHLAAVRRMFSQLDVFIFTLGLTESWVSRLDGAVYPVAPGVVGGEYDPSRYEFVNFSVSEVVADLRSFVTKLTLVNPLAKVILTVSPVPLVATATDRHVLAATLYSKSVLRVAAEEITRAHAQVYYFPSYEIITGPHIGGGYFQADRRNVSDAGVDHVMRVFMSRMTGSGHSEASRGARPLDNETNPGIAELEALADAACDEEVLAR